MNVTRYLKMTGIGLAMFFGSIVATDVIAQTLEAATVSSTGGAVLPDGTILVIGQPLVGTMSNEEFTTEVGAVPSLLEAACLLSSQPTLQSQFDPYRMIMRCAYTDDR